MSGASMNRVSQAWETEKAEIYLKGQNFLMVWRFFRSVLEIDILWFVLKDKGLMASEGIKDAVWEIRLKTK